MTEKIHIRARGHKTVAGFPMRSCSYSAMALLARWGLVEFCRVVQTGTRAVRFVDRVK